MTPIDEQTARARLKGILSRLDRIMVDTEKAHELAHANMVPFPEYERICKLSKAALDLGDVYYHFCGSAQVWLYGANAIMMPHIATLEELNDAIDQLSDPVDALNWLCIRLDHAASQISVKFITEPQCIDLAETARNLADAGRAEPKDWTNGELRRMHIESMGVDELRQRMIALWWELRFVQSTWAIHLPDLEGDYSRGVRRGRQHCIEGLAMVLDWVEAPLGADGRPVEQIERV